MEEFDCQGIDAYYVSEFGGSIKRSRGLCGKPESEHRNFQGGRLSENSDELI